MNESRDTVQVDVTYRLGSLGGAEYIECLVCHLRSFHPMDISNLYCGHCHDFHRRQYIRTAPEPSGETGADSVLKIARARLMIAQAARLDRSPDNKPLILAARAVCSAWDSEACVALPRFACLVEDLRVALGGFGPRDPFHESRNADHDSAPKFSEVGSESAATPDAQTDAPQPSPVSAQPGEIHNPPRLSERWKWLRQCCADAIAANQASRFDRLAAPLHALELALAEAEPAGHPPDVLQTIKRTLELALSAITDATARVDSDPASLYPMTSRKIGEAIVLIDAAADSSAVPSAVASAEAEPAGVPPNVILPCWPSEFNCDEHDGHEWSRHNEPTEWCPLCGALRVAAEPAGESPVVDVIGRMLFHPAFRGLWRSRTMHQDGKTETGWSVTFTRDGDYCEVPYQATATEACQQALDRLIPEPTEARSQAPGADSAAEPAAAQSWQCDHCGAINNQVFDYCGSCRKHKPLADAPRAICAGCGSEITGRSWTHCDGCTVELHACLPPRDAAEPADRPDSYSWRAGESMGGKPEPAKGNQ